MPSIRLTPIYTQRNELVFPVEAASAEFPFPVGRKELATTWWKGCPNSCRAHLPQSKGVCRRNCAALRRNVSILSKRMIDYDDKSSGGTTSSNKELIRVHSTCRYTNLIHMRHMVKRTKCAPSMCDLRIGDDSNFPWMRFHIEILVTNAKVSTPRSVPVKGDTRWVTDDATHPRKRRRTDSSTAGNDVNSWDINSSVRRLFHDDHNLIDGRHKRQVQVAASSEQSERKNSVRQSFQSNVTNVWNTNDDDLDDNSGLSADSAQRGLVDDGDRFSTQVRSPVENEFAGQSVHSMSGSDGTIVYGNHQSWTESNCRNQISKRRDVGFTLRNTSPICAAKDSKKPSSSSRLDGLPPSSQDYVGGSMYACPSAGGVSVEQLNVTTMDVEATDFDRGEAKATPGREDIPPLSSLSLPDCRAERSDNNDTDDDDMYEETQANEKRSRQNNKLSRPLERKAYSLTVDDWKELQRSERGRETTFRKALIDLIVAKNGANKPDDTAWLLPLLDAETIVR